MPRLPLRPSARPSSSGAIPLRRGPVNHPATAGDASSMTVSVVLAVFDPPPGLLQQQLDAIAMQTHSNWECILVDDASTDPDVQSLLVAWAVVDERRQLIRRSTNGGIAAATNDGLDAATGDIVTICDHDDLIDTAALAAVADHFTANPNDVVVYTDEQIIDAHGAHVSPYDKPDYSPIRHLGHHYLAHLVAARRSAVGDIRVRPEFEPSQDYDFYLRVIERATRGGRSVGHIARCLYSWRAIAGSSALDAAEKPEMAAAVQRCVHAALGRREIDATAITVVHDGAQTTSVRIQFRVDTPSTIEVIELRADSLPESINARVERSDADVITLVSHADVYDAAWARPLAAQATRPDVGAVGPRIVTSNGLLLSVGRVVQPELSDPFSGVGAGASGPWGAFFVAREVNAVAPHGCTVERSKFVDAGGLSTDVGLDAAIAELCARLAASGNSCVWTPAAELTLDIERLISDAQAVDDDMAVVEARSPSIRTERYATTGSGPVGHERPSAHVEARRLLASGRIELVTSDVFDTLVTRSAATPRDVFVDLGHRLVDAGLLPTDVTAALFAEARVGAERDARRLVADAAGLPQVAAPECNLTEIWESMPSSWVSGAPLHQYIEHELAVEADRLRPIPEGVAVMEQAHAAGITTHLVSDIYLSAEQLKFVLGAAGLDLSIIDHVTASSDHRLGKANGLLAQVIVEHGVDPSTVLHIGDNPHADVATALELGAHPIDVDVPPSNRVVALPTHALTDWSRVNGHDGGITAALRATLVAAGALGTDPAYQFGAAVAGPLLTGFSRWVSVTAEALQVDTIHCLLREGATIAELLDITSPGGPRPSLLHSSRWVMTRAACLEATPAELVNALARRAELDADLVGRAFSCDRRLVESVIGTGTVPHADFIEACEAMASDDDLREQIVASAAEQRARVLRYLDGALTIGSGPIVISDVGWGGRIQESLTTILRSAGIDNDVVGLYLALSFPGEERVQRGAHMQSYLPSVNDDPIGAETSRTIAHHADIVERVMTPELGTLVDIDADGQPVCLAANLDAMPPSLRVAQGALRDSVRRLVHENGGLDDATWVSDLSFRLVLGEAMAEVITSPSSAVATTLNRWPHDDLAGTNHQSIGGAALGETMSRLTARDVDLIEWNESSWRQGLAAEHNPALAAQLIAIDAGAPLDSVSAPSASGVARLAAFSVGSDLAALQEARHPGATAKGWSTLRLRGPIETVRSVRFDPGDGATLAEVERFDIMVCVDDDHWRRVEYAGFTSAGLQWVDAHPLDDRRLAAHAGGHLIVPIDAELSGRCTAIDVQLVFRAWPIDSDSSLLNSAALSRAGDQARRVIGAASRRIRAQAQAIRPSSSTS